MANAVVCDCCHEVIPPDQGSLSVTVEFRKGTGGIKAEDDLDICTDCRTERPKDVMALITKTWRTLRPKVK